MWFVVPMGLFHHTSMPSVSWVVLNSNGLNPMVGPTNKWNKSNNTSEPDQGRIDV